MKRLIKIKIYPDIVVYRLYNTNRYKIRRKGVHKKSHALLSTLLVFLFTIVSLAVVDAQSSSTLDAPKSTAGKWASGPTVNLTTAKPTAMGEDCSVTFSKAYALQSNFQSSNDRKLTVLLMEWDLLRNDTVYEYSCTFNGRTPTLKFGKDCKTPGAIEATNDKTAELFIKYMVDPMGNDPTDPSIASGLFQYVIKLD